MAKVDKTKPRREDEDCEYCYQSRVFISENIAGGWTMGIYEKFEQNCSHLICICDPWHGCWDRLCGYYLGRQSA